MALDDTVGGANSNSYATVAEANVYLSERLHVTEWTEADSATKEAALIMSTRMLDAYVVFQGEKTDENVQVLDWPRTNAWNEDAIIIPYDVIPTELKHAVFELAITLLKGDRAADNDMAGFKSIKVGSLALVADKNDRPDMIPEVVWKLLGPLGTNAPMGGMVMLQRV